MLHSSAAGISYFSHEDYYYYYIIIIIIIIIIEKDEWKKVTSKNFGMVSTWEKKKRKTSKFLDVGSNNRNEKEGN